MKQILICSEKRWNGFEKDMNWYGRKEEYNKEKLEIILKYYVLF